MEVCQGDVLQRVQASPTGRLDETTTLQCFRQLARAVRFLHQHGIAHRDFFLDNVLLQDKSVCKLCDFGLSVSANRVCSDIVGKAYYMAPEVVAESTYDPTAADMWSLGIMLTGSPLTQFALPHKCELTLKMLFGLA
ncbi:TPA: hypothetical protein N0F65_012559 [Lagenidium giganteum]|uniref:Protein kinase domain-containing protein n=1 Tax=Lagenidium giganteum TaxID=4803 RepID=A0AAV2YPW3_9STRA|nr:TPA: hypothetical protein N0F65_012559 [Lagenidium giganteum]